MATIQINGENYKYDKRRVIDGKVRYFHQGLEVVILDEPLRALPVETTEVYAIPVAMRSPELTAALTKSAEKVKGPRPKKSRTAA